MRSWGPVTLIALALLASGCTEERPEPTLAPPLDAPVEAGPPSYDASLEPAAAVLALVPQDATRLSVTDLDEVRLLLGTPLLTSADPAPQREDFWARAATEAPLLTTGLLRPFEGRLLRDYGFTQDDVSWEASFSGGDGAAGWVLRLRDGLAMTGVEQAVADGVGPLAGATVDPATHLVSLGAASDPDASWAADPALTALVAPGVADATYVERDCLPFETVFGPGLEDRLAAAPAADLADLDPLGSWSVSFGGALATVRLGEGRDDAFERLRLADSLPATDPELGLGFASGVADPLSGRIGYVMPDPVVATRLTAERHLPFAVCAG